MTAPLLAVEALSAWYHKDQEVLHGLDLQLAENQVVGLIGLNGAGKTTFLNVLASLHRGFRARRLAYRGKDISPAARQFKEQRYAVFSEDDSFGYLTFREYLLHVFRAYGQTLDDGVIASLVQGFGFQQYENTLLKDLSTGNKRKAFLITGFALRRPLLLLDEPVNGLDFQSTEFLYQCMERYTEWGTLLFSSHILESITLTSDKVVVLQNGSIGDIFTKGQIKPEYIRGVLRDDFDV